MTEIRARGPRAIAIFERPVFARLRKLCLALPETTERDSHGHPAAGFFATPYGRGVWASAWVDRAINPKTMASLVEQSYRLVATKRLLGTLRSSTKK